MMDKCEASWLEHRKIHKTNISHYEFRQIWYAAIASTREADDSHLPAAIG